MSFRHYNCWCDIRPSEAEGLDRIRSFTEQLVVKRSVHVSSYLFDDGWDDPNKLWQLEAKQFPHGSPRSVATQCTKGTRGSASGSHPGADMAMQPL